MYVVTKAICNNVQIDSITSANHSEDKHIIKRCGNLINDLNKVIVNECTKII